MFVSVVPSFVSRSLLVVVLCLVEFAFLQLVVSSQ